jgi:hypothetical protein
MKGKDRECGRDGTIWTGGARGTPGKAWESGLKRV